MSTITIEIKSPELIEALNNLAKAQIATAEEFKSIHTKAEAYNDVNQAKLSAAVQQMPSAYALDNRKQTNPPNKPIQKQDYSVCTYPNTSSQSIFSQPEYYLHNSKESQEQNLTLDDLARAAAFLLGGGKYQILVDLLSRFGVQALHQLPKEYFGAFAAALRQLGAQI